MKSAQFWGWGVVIYALMYLLWSGLSLYGVAPSAARLILLAALVGVALLAGHSLRKSTWKDALPFSLAWVLEIALLDSIYSAPFSGLAIYSDWNLWIGYALVILVPLLPTSTSSHAPTVPQQT